jgi:lipid II:glycine glycyltransferase (peptidoglycan interpeptide bridge formation enzyme)
MIISLEKWNEFNSAHPETHLLQTGEWGELKSQFGWKSVRLVDQDMGAQILFRTVPGGLSIAYIPKGPVGGFTDSMVGEIDEVCRMNNAIFLKVEPNQWESCPDGIKWDWSGWQPSKTVQPRRTILIPLSNSEDEILAGMKQKTRYNIHLAAKKEIVVKPSNDLDDFQKMMLVTGSRDKIGVHAQQYYEKAYELFHDSGRCEILFAYFDGTPIAGIMVFAQGKTAWYMYGASTEIERNRMPTYLLQWEAIRWAKEKGCEVYDLWGIPDRDEEELEESFDKKYSHDGLWGVYRFKRGFGGKVVRSIGAWDRVYRPLLYRAYNTAMKIRGGIED